MSFGLDRSSHDNIEKRGDTGMKIMLDEQELTLPEGILNGGKKAILEFVQKRALAVRSYNLQHYLLL